MKFKMLSGFLALFFISVGALGVTNSDYFVPAGKWQGSYNAQCNGKGMVGNATMYVEPQSITDNNGLSTEYFTGILIAENLPVDCLNIDFAQGVPLAKGTYAIANTNPPMPLNLHVEVLTKAGIVPAWNAGYWSFAEMEIIFIGNGGNNFLDMVVSAPN